MSDLSGKTYSFCGVIYKLGSNRCVDIPSEISANLGSDNYIPIKGEAGGININSTLVPRGKNRHRLFIHSNIWKTLSIDEGNEIDVWIELDNTPREPELPEDLENAINVSSKALKRFKAASPTLRLRIVEWVNSAKQLSTREKRIIQTIERLESDERLG